MKKSMLVLAMSLVALNSASAQESSALDANHFSLAGGFGFFAEDNFDGFMINFEGTYHATDHISAGVDLQLGFDKRRGTDILILSMPFYGQYDFGNFPVDVDVIEDMHVFTKLGIGFTYAEADPRGPVKFDDTGFLFVIGGGLAYSVNEHISVESRMQFNIGTNDFLEDDFYFSWEVVSMRYRF